MNIQSFHNTADHPDKHNTSDSVFWPGCHCRAGSTRFRDPSQSAKYWKPLFKLFAEF